MNMVNAVSCPFNDPEFEIGFDDSCPTCGVKSGDPQEIDDKCVEGLLGDKLAKDSK